MKVCLTGATGFIGKNLLKKLEARQDIEVIALSRKLPPIMDEAKRGNVTWRRCNGFSLIDAESATKGADVLIYLIHSMLPTSSLSQGSFKEFDLYLADNFARAAKKNGVKHIIYLSGIIPNTDKLSDHLTSRLEVEKVLGSRGNKVTSLRAALIVGKNGSSFQILERLIKRLPILICPAWTKSNTQPIDLEDVLASLKYCLDNYSTLKSVYDIGGPDVLTYEEMLKKSAIALGKKRYFFSVPLFSPGLSKLWVSKITGTSHQLVYPLVESLKHEMVVRPDQALLIDGHTYTPFLESLKKGFSKQKSGWVRDIINYSAFSNFSWLKNVTSMQNIEGLNIQDAQIAANEYYNWLPRFMGPFIKVKVDGPKAEFYFFKSLKLLQLEKSHERSTQDRVIYYVTGGILASRSTLNGRLEFRYISSLNYLLIALLDFRPALPWFIYKYTQALVHLYVMKNFLTHLRTKFQGSR